MCALSQCFCKMLTLQCWIIGGEMECWALVISVLHPRLPLRFGMPKLQMHGPGHRSWCISANNGSHVPLFQVGTGFTLLANGYQPNSKGSCNAWTAYCILVTLLLRPFFHIQSLNLLQVCCRLSQASQVSSTLNAAASLSFCLAISVRFVRPWNRS